jgi:serine/threonine protein kinase
MRDKDYEEVADGVLGEGTFGKVEKVLRISKKDIVARKTISFQNYETRPEAKDAIQREVRVLSRLEHPNIIRYIEVEWEFDHANLYAEFCDGPNLDVYIEHNWM